MKLLCRYLLLLLVYTAAVILVAMIPHRAIENNCRTSIAYILEQGEYPMAFGLPFLKTDNFTDLLMLNHVWCSNDTLPIESSIMNYIFWGDNNDLFEASQQMITQPAQPFQPMEYSRYWHGFQIVLRPLLILTDYKRLITYNYVLLMLLAFWCLHEVWQHSSSLLPDAGRMPYVSISMGIVLLMIAFPAVPLCFQYSVCFYIMFLFIIAMLRSKTVRLQDSCSFFTVGALTAFFDLLTTPLLTLGIPLLVSMQDIPAADRMRRTIQLSISWLLGYASLWLSKCMVAWLLTRQNIIGTFMEEVCMRSLIGLNTVRQLIVSHPIACTLIILLSIVLVILIVRRILSVRSRHAWLLFVAALPMLWYAVLLQHTIIHFFFVWRIMAITLLALLLLVIEFKAKGEKQVLYE